MDFVFIDADHRTEGVKEDIRRWLPKLKLDGWLTGDDANWPSVRAALDELCPGYETQDVICRAKDGALVRGQVWSIPRAKIETAL